MNRQASRLAGSLSVAVLLSVPGPVTAADRAHREHAAHEHGHGVLEVVFEGKMLAIGLRVPAVNVVGFEHAPETDAQKHAVEEAVARFRAGEKLFVLPAQAKCKAPPLDVELAGMDDRAHAGHGGHEQHAKDEHGHEKASEESHAELDAEYQFECAHPEKLGLIQVLALSALNNVEELEAQVVTEDFQAVTEVTSKVHTLRLRR